MPRVMTPVQRVSERFRLHLWVPRTPERVVAWLLVCATATLAGAGAALLSVPFVLSALLLPLWGGRPVVTGAALSMLAALTAMAWGTAGVCDPGAALGVTEGALLLTVGGGLIVQLRDRGPRDRTHEHS